MTVHELPNRAALATSLPMQGIGKMPAGSGRRGFRAGMVMAGLALALSGCISVNAPDKPIVIELNINIKQEVIYRLAAEAANTIEANPELF
ncbi:MAG TPA: YnbE family lipoprotein [Novosphingobium sp.]|nr:YnbE family lipoprotein [Novosphingobium sp.]